MLIRVPDKPFPISYAVNAYDTFEDVAQLVLDEPRRLDMAQWVARKKYVEQLEPERRPSCNTICCWAGWTATATRLPGSIGSDDAFEYYAHGFALALYGVYDFHLNVYGQLRAGRLSPSLKKSEVEDDLNNFFIDSYPGWRGTEEGSLEQVEIVVRMAMEVRDKHADFFRAVTYPRPVMTYEVYRDRCEDTGTV